MALRDHACIYVWRLFTQYTVGWLMNQNADIIIIVIYVVFSAWRLLLPGFKCEYYLFPPPYRFRSPVVGEFTAPVRNLLIEFVGPDLNDQLIAIGSERPNVPPVAAGFIITVRIRTSGGMCLYTYVCIIHLHVHICASVTLRSMF